MSPSKILQMPSKRDWDLKFQVSNFKSVLLSKINVSE
jgi:hypothetical protein